MTSEKILPFDAAAERIAALRAQGLTVVQCHGTFDLIHPGHVYHLEEAKALGDLLVVTLTGEKHVNKGPGRPYFNDHLRAKTLSALQCVDYVVVVPHAAAVEAIDCVRPTIYCKGREYEDPEHDVTGNIVDDVRAVEKHGGRVAYVGTVVFSSTRLLNSHFDHLAGPVRDFCRTLAGRYSPDDFRRRVEQFADLKVLVIGDTIFDRYSSVAVQGLASKNQIISGRFLRQETQCGGGLAVLRHVSQFTQQVQFLSLIGPEPWAEQRIREVLPRESDRIVRDPDFITVVKERFVEPLSHGKELNKLFSVNYLDADPPSRATVDRVLQQVERLIEGVDAVLLADFGHGLMHESVREMVQAKAPFLALNCQTNSNNQGFNIISRQYARADAFSLDAHELMLASGQRHLDDALELARLRSRLSADVGWLTRGPVQTIGVNAAGESCLCPPLEDDVVDTVGAGDAFFSVASLAAARGEPIDVGTFMGQLAGAQAVRIIGNSEPISRARLLKSAMSLLTF